MAWVWTTYGAIGLASGALALTVAAVVYAGAPGRTQNRLLASLLAVLGGVMTSGFGLMYLTDEAASTYAWQAVAIVLYLPFLGLYFGFLSTIPTPLAPVLRRAWPAYWALGLLGPVLYFGWTDRFIAGIEPGTYSPWDAVLGPWWAMAFYLSAAVGVFGLLLAVMAFLRSRKGTLQRSQAVAYLAAFAVLDVSQHGVNVYFAMSGGFDVVGGYVQLGGSIVFLLLLAYGMLKTNPFDIDLKIKWTLSRGTVAGIFLVVFLVVSQFIERVASENLGYVSGAIAAGLLLLPLNALQKAADRLADKAMPRTEATPAYVAFRKLEVYKAAVEELLVGGITAKERRALDALRAKLDLAPSDAHAMERNLMGTLAT